MKKNKLTQAALAAALIGLGISPVLAAQGNDDDSLFDEITVTATKREQNIYEVPMSISAFDGDTIQAQGITDLVDIGKFVPNLNVTTFSAGHTSSANPFIRGIGLQDHLITTDPGVSVYVDGVYLGRQVGQNWSLSNIERIEVLRGPQGTLYGRNSIGGAINIITKEPGSFDGARVGMELGTRGRVNTSFYGDVNLSDSLAMSVTGGFKRRSGIGEFRNIANAKQDVGQLQDVFARVALNWKPNDAFSLLIAGDGNEGTNGLNPYTTLIDEIGPGSALYDAGFRNSDIAANPYDNNTGQENQIQVTNKAYGVSLTANWDFTDNLATKLIASTRHSEYQAGLDDDSLFEDFLSFPEIGFADQDSIELQLNGDFGRFDFVSGLYFFQEYGENDQNPFTFNGGPGSEFLSQDVDSKAIFANVGFNATDQLRISGGLRWTKDEKTASTDLIFGLIMETANRDWSELSWDLSANYTMDNGLNIYGTIANGYQSGQFPPRPFCLFGSLDFTQPGNVSRPNCFAANDNVTALNYEIGIKGQPFDNLQMSAAVFYTDYSDLPYQVSTTAAGGGFNTVNIIVDQTSTGFEWESTLLIGDDFRFQATFGYINVDVADPTAVAPLTPDTTFSLSPVYTVPLAGGASIDFRADYSYRAEMFGEPSPDPGRLTKIDSRSIVNFDIAYHAPDETWTAALYGRNVTDERYDNARLNTGDYILRILSNDASEFGVRFIKSW